MKAQDYLRAKYGLHKVTTMLASEAKIFGIKWLESGWCDKDGAAFPWCVTLHPFQPQTESTS